MRLRSLKVERATSCGGLLDGLSVSFARDEENTNQALTPLCLLGPNGSGKSQFLQLIAEIFQSAWHVHAPMEERDLANADALFELEYEIAAEGDKKSSLVKLSRTAITRPLANIEMAIHIGSEWEPIPPETKRFGHLLPALVVGYTSGDNETLSLPFLISRSGYARDVGVAALKEDTKKSVADNRLLLIDYGTHLEVLVANLLLGNPAVRAAMLKHAALDRLASCRCIVQLNHSVAPNAPRNKTKRKGIQLTDELEMHLDALRRSATCWEYDNKSETYIFDFFVDEATRKAFVYFFGSAMQLYRALHKLALLNDLAIPKKTRERLKRETRNRRFASRLPEPQDEDKVFRFEQVRLHRTSEEVGAEPVDYVSLSDGEHQQAEIFGVFSMITTANSLFVLDEPESHFNPQWRVQFVKRLLDLPAADRGSQEVLMTSHAPFVPSDMSREQVLIFKKINDKVSVGRPDIETFGASFDRILEHCFDVHPPISQMARDEIDNLMRSGNIDQIQAAMNHLGSSVEKAFLADKLRELTKSGGAS